MGLYQRWTANDSTKIGVHTFGAALRQWAAGELTRQQVIDGFGLTGDDVTQLDALRSTYDALPSSNAAQASAKAAYLQRFEDVAILSETGYYTEQKARSALGF